MLRYLVLATTCGFLLAASSVHAAGIRRVQMTSSLTVLDIRFVDGTATLTDESRHMLADTARALASLPEQRIEVQASLQPGLTQTIAHRRAAAVRAYLDTHGMDDTRLSTRVVPAHGGQQIELIQAD